MRKMLMLFFKSLIIISDILSAVSLDDEKNDTLFSISFSATSLISEWSSSYVIIFYYPLFLISFKEIWPRFIFASLNLIITPCSSSVQVK